MEANSSAVKLPERETDHSSPSSAEVKNCGAIPKLPNTSSLRGAELIMYRDNFTFTKDISRGTWQKFDYRLDLYPVINSHNLEIKRLK
jgi:hypothetical protein